MVGFGGNWATESLAFFTFGEHVHRTDSVRHDFMDEPVLERRYDPLVPIVHHHEDGV